MIDYKLILETIAAIEQSFDVNSVQYNGLSIWPLVRWKIYDQMRYPTSMMIPRSNTQVNREIPILGARQKQIQFWRKHKNTDILFLSRINEHCEKIQGKFYNPWIDSLIDLAQKHHSFLKIEHLDESRTLETFPRFEQTVFFHPECRGYEILAGTESIKGFSDLQIIVFDSTMVWLHELFFVEQVRLLEAWQAFFTEILSEVQPKAVFIICYYYIIAMALVRACKKLNITTVDVQHGCYEKYHGLYTHWTKVPAQGYDLLPDYFWCWSRPFQNGVEKWYAPDYQHHKVIVGGYPRLIKWIEGDLDISDKNTEKFYNRLKQNNKVILVTLDGKEGHEEPQHLLDAMSQSPDDWLWLIRLHPEKRSQDEKDRIINIIRQHGIQNYEIEYATLCPLYGLLKRCDHHVTGCSSTFYEALAFGVPTTMTLPQSLLFYEDHLKDGILSYADNSESILKSIGNDLPNPALADRSKYIVTNRQCAEVALKTILNPSSQIISQPNKLNQTEEN